MMMKTLCIQNESEFQDVNRKHVITRFDEGKVADLLLDVSSDTVNETPKEITLDFDNTDDPVHGDQE
jgi:hypothetical protein